MFSEGAWSILFNISESCLRRNWTAVRIIFLVSHSLGITIDRKLDGNQCPEGRDAWCVVVSNAVLKSRGSKGSWTKLLGTQLLIQIDLWFSKVFRSWCGTLWEFEGVRVSSAWSEWSLWMSLMDTSLAMKTCNIGDRSLFMCLIINVLEKTVKYCVRFSIFRRHLFILLRWWKTEYSNSVGHVWHLLQDGMHDWLARYNHFSFKLISCPSKILIFFYISSS